MGLDPGIEPSLPRQQGGSKVERDAVDIDSRELGEPDVRIKLTERAWTYDPAVIQVTKGQVVEITFEPTDNGLGVGHGFGISGYDESVFINGAMVGVPSEVLAGIWP